MGVQWGDVVAFCIPRVGVWPRSSLCAEGNLCRSWIPALEPSTPIPSSPKSQPVLWTFGGPAEATKGPLFPRAGPDWDPGSHQDRLGASFPSEGTSMREGWREPLSWGWAVSSAGTHPGSILEVLLPGQDVPVPSGTRNTPSSRGRASPKPSLPLQTSLPEALWCHVPAECGGWDWDWDWDTPMPNPFLLPTKPPQSLPLGPC